MTQTVTDKNFRQTMGCFTTGVAVVTAHDAALGAVGLTINSLTSVSLQPPLLLFCLDKNAHLYRALRRADLFAINILADGQHDVSAFFARRDQPKPKNLWGAARRDCPILRNTLAWALCKPYKYYAGGDHTIFVGEVIDLGKPAAKQPLAYFQGGYRPLGKDTSGARK